MDKQANYAIGQQIKRFRKEAKLRQSDLAEIIGLSRTQLLNMENGINSPTIENLYKIAEALHISIHKLVPENKKPKILVKLKPFYYDKK